VKLKKRIGILTGGGDVPPLNSVIQSVIDSANNNGFELVGFKFGWKGILDKDFVLLNKTIIPPNIGGTILKSSRINLSKYENGDSQILENLDNLKIEGLIVIGGEDTLSNSFYLQNLPQVLISKTIDNDVGIISDENIVNYFTLGYPTAAEKISSFVSLDEGLRTTAYSHERIIVVESMGMHAGWLALSSAMGWPDFIIIPEFPLDYDKFKQLVAEKYNKQRNIIIVIAEGAKWSDGTYVSADQNEIDSFGHPRFLGSSALLANRLKSDLRKYFDTRNVNSVNPSYLYRSGKPNKLDFTAAKLLGYEAVNLLKEGSSSLTLLTLNYSEGQFSVGRFSISGMNTIEQLHRFVPQAFYNSTNYQATEKGKKYLEHILCRIPQINYELK